MGQKGFLGEQSDEFFGNRGPEAAQSAAMAQQAEARRQYDEQKKIYDTATTKGLMTFDQALQGQEKNISRQEQLIAQIDPTIMEASQQALKLLRGEQSSTLAPMQKQRELQRAQLVNHLREQLGPGAETSTAGIQALNRFDSETSSLSTNAQQSAIQLLGGVGAQFNSIRPNMLQENTGLANLGQGRAALQFGQAEGLRAAGAPLIGSAGAQFTQSVLQGQQSTARLNSWLDSSLKFGEAFGGAGMGAGGGGGGSANTGSTPDYKSVSSSTPSTSYFSGKNPYS